MALDAVKGSRLVSMANCCFLLLLLLLWPLTAVVVAADDDAGCWFLEGNSVW